jgi:hypothetical protein
MKRLPTLLLLATAGSAMTVAACAGTTTVPTVGAPAGVTSPAPLASAWYANGNPTPTVAAARVAPGALVPAAVSSWGYLQTASPVPAARMSTASTAGTCGPYLHPGFSTPVAATAGTGRATVSFPDLGDPSVLMYRIGAVPQGVVVTPSAGSTVGTATPKWQSVGAGHTCTTLTVTVTGLTSNTAYEFWLDAVHTDTTYGTSNVTKETMIGRSVAVMIL